MTSLVALALAVGAVVGLIGALWGLNFLFLVLETYLGRPRIKFLKSTIPGHGFAFSFVFNEEKEEAKYDVFKLKLFNPYGTPTQAEIARNFSAQKNSFAQDFDMGEGLVKLLGAKNFQDAVVTIELTSTEDGINYQYEMKGSKFKKKLSQANLTVEDFNKKESIPMAKPPIDVPVKTFIADTVPGKGAQPAIESNPAFAHLFGGSSDGGAPAAAAVQFSVAKVWIAPGCIVCNACEDIYPEVFEVTADTCLIRLNAPLDDGLKIKDAAEACPVEVIKYTVAS